MDFKSKVPMNTIGINKRVSRPSPIRVEVIVLNAKYFPFRFLPSFLIRLSNLQNFQSRMK